MGFEMEYLMSAKEQMPSSLAVKFNAFIKIQLFGFDFFFFYLFYNLWFAKSKFPSFYVGIKHGRWDNKCFINIRIYPCRFVRFDELGVKSCIG